jgi:ATP-dependent Lhr-like helicase
MIQSGLDSFHQATSAWFKGEFAAPTEIQLKAWPEIQNRTHTLIAAPTGSGKTLAAFLATIDDLVKQGIEGELGAKTQVVYVSPLKALSNDIEKNLQNPLKGIAGELVALGLDDVGIRVMVRTGDTPASARTKMAKNPPHILVTTPESLYLLLTSKSGRNMLSDVKTVIVDEIHAMVGSKRGSHLSLSLERLDNLTSAEVIRIGLSATQKPIEMVAKFLVGSHGECAILDVGHKREMDLAIEVPGSPLTAVMANEVWEEIYARLEVLINSHQTTLIFVNTRRLAERMAHNLTEKLGPHMVTAHHGSMSKEHRLDAEQRLKSGTLRALVATASLELGIDIGSVDLVCQMGSPKSIAALLQRVGRSGHTVDGEPKGRIFPLSRNELVECAALLDSVNRGELDRIVIPEKPVDVLAQQIVAEVAARDYVEDELYDLVRQAYPYRDLERKTFDDVVGMLSDGFTTRVGRRRAYLHRDLVNGRVKGRKNARITALVSGGVIPDTFDYDVYLEPSNTFIGTLNEDFAIESMAGDVFQLGNNSWSILRIENGRVRVADAEGAAPSIPFWLGEAPGRTAEFSISLSRFREEVSSRFGSIGEAHWADDALAWLTNDLGISTAASDQIVNYLGAAAAALGGMPTQNRIVIERFFDDAGDMHVVLHSPFGSRLNRAWGLALRKRFCRKFNFELQAAANEDSIMLSLGSTHSFRLDEVFQYLQKSSVRTVLTQALLDSPMFQVRWRWNATNALAVQRRQAGKKVPAILQKIQSEDLVALVFPDQLACLENIAGEREIPDHPLVEQAIRDCLYEAMDIEELEDLIGKIQDGIPELVAVDLRSPSPLAEDIVNARPYAFLDDAPLEERRANAIRNRRWLDPAEARDLGKLDQESIDSVKAEAWPLVRDADELHDGLVLSGFLPLGEIEKGDGECSWAAFADELSNQGRASMLVNGEKRYWVSAERSIQMGELHPDSEFLPAFVISNEIKSRFPGKENAVIEILRSRLEALGPMRERDLVQEFKLAEGMVAQALVALEVEGFAIQGHFSPGCEDVEWCERRLLARIHRHTLDRLRKEIRPVSSADYMRFLFSWHRMVGDRPEGIEALFEVLHQLEGYEAPAAAWEGDILPVRVKEYDHAWLDALCSSGRIAWGRFRQPRVDNGKQPFGPIKTTPISLITRQNLALWAQKPQENEPSSYAAQVAEALEERGALFFDEIGSRTGMLKSQVEEGISELVALGRITADSFTGLRALLVESRYRTRHRRNKSPIFSMEMAGRWSLLPGGDAESDAESIERIARTLLRRYGVIFRKIAFHEEMSPPWRELVRVCRRLEARGEIRGGRFVEGVWGEQFALPEVIPILRSVRKQSDEEQFVSICAADPLNLTGVITPGKRVPSLFTNRILYRNGVPVAVKEGKETRLLEGTAGLNGWDMENRLRRWNISPKLKPYLNRGVG